MAEECYRLMFENCTSLAEAPLLPSTELANNCYTGMFRGCSSFTTLPSLPATNLANYCYASMFAKCTSLVTLPLLPATTLKDGCYNTMFKDCTSLVVNTEAPGTPWSISATIDTDNDLRAMFSGTGGTMNGTPEVNTTYYIASAPTAVQEVADNIELAIAPNPVRLGEAAQITVEDGSMVEVYNMNGQCVWQKCDAAGSVNVSGLNEAGVYVVKVTKGNGLVETGKLIVE